MNPMSIEHRLLLQECLLEAVLRHSSDAAWRSSLAAAVYLMTEAAQRHQSLPHEVLAELNRVADGLTGLDNLPDSLKPGLRWLIQPAPDAE